MRVPTNPGPCHGRSKAVQAAAIARDGPATSCCPAYHRCAVASDRQTRTNAVVQNLFPSKCIALVVLTNVSSLVMASHFISWSQLVYESRRDTWKLKPRHIVSTSSGHQGGASVANVLEIGRTSRAPRRSDLARWQKRTLPSLFVALRAKELDRAVSDID